MSTKYFPDYDYIASFIKLPVDKNKYLINFDENNSLSLVYSVTYNAFFLKIFQKIILLQLFMVLVK